MHVFKYVSSLVLPFIIPHYILLVKGLYIGPEPVEIYSMLVSPSARNWSAHMFPDEGEVSLYYVYARQPLIIVWDRKVPCLSTRCRESWLLDTSPKEIAKSTLHLKSYEPLTQNHNNIHVLMLLP